MPRARANEINLSLRVRGIAKAVAGLKGFSRAATQSGRVTQRAFMGVRGLLRGITGLIARSGRFLSLAFLGASAAAIKYSGSLEMLKLRLRAASSSAEEAEASFKTMFEFSKRTPFTPQEVMQAGILMKSFGIEGKQALDNVGSAALVMGRNFMDVVLALGSMKTEPLRRLGIEFRKVGEVGTFVFRDKLGKEITRTSKGIQDTRNTLVDILGMKFGGGLEAASKTIPGMMSTLVGHLQFASASFGDGFRGAVKAAMNMFNSALERWTNDGRLKKIGDQVENGARVFGVAVLALTRDIKDNIKDVASILGNSIVKAFGTAVMGLSAALALFIDAFDYLQTEFWAKMVGIGKGGEKRAQSVRDLYEERSAARLAGHDPNEDTAYNRAVRDLDAALKRITDRTKESNDAIAAAIAKFRGDVEMPAGGAEDLGEGAYDQSSGGTRNISVGDLRRWERGTMRRLSLQESKARQKARLDAGRGRSMFGLDSDRVTPKPRTFGRSPGFLSDDVKGRFGQLMEGHRERQMVIDEAFYLRNIMMATQALAKNVGGPE